ncbi:MAG: exonuclease SbcCD subunit D C-terminal domain-containing protein [Bacillota bacterium]
MKILHTSDWHLGRSLYGRKRYEEFEAFLEWLANTIQAQAVDVLLVAGDIFDTSTPSNRAQELYYRFLCRVAASNCRHIVIIAGNHDSPSFLNAPKQLLRALDVHVVGVMTENPEDEVIVLFNKNNQPEAIVCAVPYLRDKDIRTVEAGETVEDKNDKLVDGLKNHYEIVCAIAEQKQRLIKTNHNVDIPLIAMGHLFTAGGKTIDGDGVRELYVGSLAHVTKSIFPESIDYLALGHLHVSQQVGGTEHIRYSGSPIPMGFGESRQEKRVFLVEFAGTTPTITDIPVPCFQILVSATGSLEEIYKTINKLNRIESTAWIEIEYSGEEMVGNLRELFDDYLAGTAVEILRVKNKRIMNQTLEGTIDAETLDSLNVNEVFERCLDAFKVPVEDRLEMSFAYNEIIKSLHEEDVNAE